MRAIKTMVCKENILSVVWINEYLDNTVEKAELLCYSKQSVSNLLIVNLLYTKQQGENRDERLIITPINTSALCFQRNFGSFALELSANDKYFCIKQLPTFTTN